MITKADRAEKRRRWLKRRKRLEDIAAAEAEKRAVQHQLGTGGHRTSAERFEDAPAAAIAAESGSRAFRMEPPEPGPRWSSGVSSVYDGPSVGASNGL